MHLCTENIRSRIRSPRSLPSKIHAATPPQNLAAVESLLRAKRAARSSFSWPHGLLSERNRPGTARFYLAAAFQIRTKWIGALFTYVRHSVLPRHSYDLASCRNKFRTAVSALFTFGELAWLPSAISCQYANERDAPWPPADGT